MVLTLFYLYYVQCDNAHIFRGTSFTHTQKRETYSKKINSCYERQKGSIVGGIDKSKSLKKIPKVQRLAKLIFRKI